QRLRFVVDEENVHSASAVATPVVSGAADLHRTRCARRSVWSHCPCASAQGPCTEPWMYDINLV
ncbi:MAG: hypothetical protein CL927_04765, partial [Deltaproteobacteria bacterium]|nr:hypothetical protein [Deltaproteobacteria bacterium]HCH62322.1 hypothetical protein [Deltaproteobacteria bacterium]